MPGKVGMRPDQSSFSVPVLMPLQSMSTTMSSAVGGVKSKRFSTKCSGLSKTTASAFMLELMCVILS